MELEVLYEVLRADVLAAEQQHGVCLRSLLDHFLSLLCHVEIALNDVLIEASDGEHLLVWQQVAECAVIQTHRP